MAAARSAVAVLLAVAVLAQLSGAAAAAVAGGGSTRRALLEFGACPSSPPSRADCLAVLPAGAPGCVADSAEVAAQAAYFMKNWFAEFRNGDATDILAPAVVFRPELNSLALADPGQPLCGGPGLVQAMHATLDEAARACHLFDVGANVGEYAEWLLKHSPRHCRIYSYEPVPTTYQVLRKRVRKHTRVHAFHKAVSDSMGTATISYGEAGDLGASIGVLARATHQSQVPQVTLESEIAQVDSARQIPFIKIDVESLELSVLRGLNQSLAQRRARSVLWEHNIKKHRCGCENTKDKKRKNPCSCTPKNSLKDEVDFLAGFGYHIYLPGLKKFLRIDSDYWHPHYEVDLHTHKGPKTPVINLLAVAPGDPILAYIVEKKTMLRPPGAFSFGS